MSGEARRPGLPAEPRGVGRGRGRAWGGEAPADRADAGRKLASKFYQLSSEEVGAGLGLRAPSAAAPKAAAAPCPGVTLSTPLPPCLGRLPAANWWGRGSGVKVKESRSRLVHSPSHTPWRHGAAGPHLILRPSEASTGLLTLVVKRKGSRGTEPAAGATSHGQQRAGSSGTRAGFAPI